MQMAAAAVPNFFQAAGRLSLSTFLASLQDVLFSCRGGERATLRRRSLARISIPLICLALIVREA